jgi:hypothetical protein
MVWVGITHCGRTDLKIVNGNLNAVRYRDEILSAIVQPFIARHMNSHTFQQDNARCHLAHIYIYLVKNHLLYCMSYRKLTFSKPHIEKLVKSMAISCLNECVIVTKFCLLLSSRSLLAI